MEDVLGFAAFGGLERIAIIAGALLVGYWGYRLYVSGKPAGLVFLGMSCLMLCGALLTGSNHVRSVGESIQLASSRTPDPDSAIVAMDNATEAHPTATAGTEIGNPGWLTPPDSASATPPSAEGLPPNAADTTRQRPTAVDGDPQALVAIADIKPDALVSPSSDGVAMRRDRLPTAQELGGRIVSVKSGNLSLEWSPASTDQ